MSVHSSNGRQRSAVSIGPPSDDAVADAISTFEEDGPNVTTTQGATPRSKRGPDYRLRGLDLGAQKKSQAPVFETRKDQPRRRHRRRLVVGWVIVLVIAAAIAMVLRGTIIEPFSVPSTGMMPTLQVNDRILVMRSRTLAGPIQRGDIVVFRRPLNYSCGASAGTGHDLVQRVIGMPGQNIWSFGYSIYVDGKQVDDRYGLDPNVGRAVPRSIPLTTVPAGEYFVVGDNLSQSCDSRSFGSIPASSVVGKVVSIVLRGGHPYIHVF
jgi:signal peptidase I